MITPVGHPCGLGQTHTSNSSDHYFHLILFCLARFGKVGTYRHTTCVEIVITTNSDFGSAEWIIIFVYREGLETGGAVLVHCYHGVSRSASIVLAYLMKSRDIDLDEALAIVTQKRPIVCPNDGFLMQLRLFRQMDCRLDSRLPSFKYYKIKIIQNQLLKTSILPPEVRSGPTQGDKVSNGNESCAADSLRTNGSLYRCKKCRSILFTRANMLPHARGNSESWETMICQDLEL